MPHNLWGLLIVLVLAFLLFSRPGRITGLMEDLGKGIKGFRKGLGDKDDKDDDNQPPPPPRVQDQSTREPARTDSDRAEN